MNIDEEDDDFIEEENDDDDGEFLDDGHLNGARRNISNNFAPKQTESSRPRRNIQRKNFMEVESDQDIQSLSEEEYI